MGLRTIWKLFMLFSFIVLGPWLGYDIATVGAGTFYHNIIFLVLWMWIAGQVWIENNW